MATDFGFPPRSVSTHYDYELAVEFTKTWRQFFDIFQAVTVLRASERLDLTKSDFYGKFLDDVRSAAADLRTPQTSMWLEKSILRYLWAIVPARRREIRWLTTEMNLFSDVVTQHYEWKVSPSNFTADPPGTEHAVIAAGATIGDGISPEMSNDEEYEKDAQTIKGSLVD